MRLEVSIARCLISTLKLHLPPDLDSLASAIAFGWYKNVVQKDQAVTLVQTFRLAIYNLSTLPSEPLLHLAMYAGLASLKLPACYDPQTKNVDCPVCDSSIGKLAEEVPFSHHVNSTIVCRITGKIMDEDNTPMAFPTNGQVYSREV